MKRFGPSSIVAASLLAAWTGLVSLPGTLAAPASFQQAVADYNGGKYATALAELDAYKAIYPTNALVHYYSALCHQALNHLEEAKTDYQFVAAHGDARLQSMSHTALDQLSRVHAQVNFSSFSQTPAAVGRGGSAAQQLAANSVAHAKVKRILEFSADW